MQEYIVKSENAGAQPERSSLLPEGWGARRGQAWVALLQDVAGGAVPGGECVQGNPHAVPSHEAWLSNQVYRWLNCHKRQN